MREYTQIRARQRYLLLEFAQNGLVNVVTEPFYRGSLTTKNNGRRVIGQLSLGLGVDTSQIQVLPSLGEQLVKVPLVMSADRDSVGDLRDQVQLLDRDLVNLVQNIQAGHVHTVALDHIDQLVDSGVTLETDVGIVDLVLGKHSLDFIQIQMRQRDSVGHADTALLLLLEVNVWWLLVESNAESLQFLLDNLLVSQGLQHIQNQKDQRAGTGDSNNLTTYVVEREGRRVKK